MKKSIKIIYVALIAIALISMTLICIAASNNFSVSFYDGGVMIENVSVNEGEIPQVAEVDEVIIIDGVGYRFLGWSLTDNGEITEITAATESCSYYAVREAVGFKAQKTDGRILWYAPGTLFSTILSASEEGDIITAYSDFAIDTSVHCTKSITVDLNGNTVNTSSYIIPNGTSHIVFCNGTVNLTSREIAQMSEYRSADAKFELRDIVVTRSADFNRYLLDVRVGSIVMDNVMVDGSEWVLPESGVNPFITVGYRTRKVSQVVKIEVKNSNITLPNITFINTTGASGETNGYTVDVDIFDSYVKSGTYIVNFSPVDTAIANSGLDFCAMGASTILADGSLFNIKSGVNGANVNASFGYGVMLSGRPKLSVGTVTLGDGDAMLDYDNDTAYGVVTDFWADDYTPVTDFDYSFCVVGDTQMTVDYDPTNMHYLYDWIVANKNSKNIKYVFGMGDITNHSADDEWEIAYNEISKLNGVVDYAVVRGNHDTSEGFNAIFNNAEYKAMFDGFYTDELVENSYVAFTVGDVKYLHITLDWRASDSVLSWASGIIEQYYDHRVIISTHAFLAADGNLLTEGYSSYGASNSGEQMWNKMLSKHENVFLILSGHVFSTDIVCTQLEGVHGNTVTAIVSNGQTLDLKNGAMGLVSMLYFSKDGKSVAVEYYSTVYDKYLKNCNQFTIDIPEYTEAEPETPDYLYAVTDLDGNTTYYDSTHTFSEVMTSITKKGTLVSVYGDVSIDTSFRITNHTSVNLNGHTISTDGGRINGTNIELNFTNGNINITNYEFVHISEGYGSARLNLRDINVSHTGTAGKMFVELRVGSLTLDNVRVAAGEWLAATSNFITAGARTKSVSQAVNITIKNSSIDLGENTGNIISFTGVSGETNGWRGNVTLINTEALTGGCIFKVVPVSAASANCAIDISVDGRCVLKSNTPIEASDLIPKNNISVSFELGVMMSAIPYIADVEISYAGGFLAFDSELNMYRVIGEGEFGCVLMDDDGNVYQYYVGTAFTKELVALAQSEGCTIVFLQDMYMPNGTGTASGSQYNITAAALNVDLNGYTLYMPSYARFTTNSSTVISFKNGTIEHAYNVYYSYSGNDDVTSFTAENVRFVATTTSTSFDHRIGILRLINCEFEFRLSNNNATAVFTFGYVNNATNEVKVYLEHCTIDALGSQRSIFKMYGGRPITLVANECTFSVEESAYLILATSSYTTTPSDYVTLSDCRISKSGEGGIFKIAYSDIVITLDEVYVPTESPVAVDKGTVVYTKGQTKAMVDGGGYMITAPKVKLEANLTLYTDFTLNIWIPTSTTILGVTVDGQEYPLSEMQIISGKYLIPIESIQANSAADAFDIYITYVDGDKTLTVIKSYSVVKYASSIINSEKYSDEVKSLLVYTLSYIDAVYTYVGKDIPQDLSDLMSSEAYALAKALATTDGVSEVPATETDRDTAGGAIYSAKLALDTSVRFIFTLNAEYTGELVLEYAGTTNVYNVEGGTVNGLNYVEVDMRAHMLYDEVISISAGEYSGTYDLAAYVHAAKELYGEDEVLNTLLLELYNYCKEADEYRAFVESSNGVLG